jgi:tripartite-type tricarboxylate transporter receptor subunit TctC
MKFVRRQFLHLAAGAAALPAASRVARAQTYRSRPVRIVVGYGAATDIVARLMGQWLSARLGKQFIIEIDHENARINGSEVVYGPPRALARKQLLA